MEVFMYSSRFTERGAAVARTCHDSPRAFAAFDPPYKTHTEGMPTKASTAASV